MLKSLQLGNIKKKSTTSCHLSRVCESNNNSNFGEAIFFDLSVHCSGKNCDEKGYEEIEIQQICVVYNAVENLRNKPASVFGGVTNADGCNVSQRIAIQLPSLTTFYGISVLKIYKVLASRDDFIIRYFMSLNRYVCRYFLFFFFRL